MKTKRIESEAIQNEDSMTYAVNQENLELTDGSVKKSSSKGSYIVSATAGAAIGSSVGVAAGTIISDVISGDDVVEGTPVGHGSDDAIHQNIAANDGGDGYVSPEQVSMDDAVQPQTVPTGNPAQVDVVDPVAPSPAVGGDTNVHTDGMPDPAIVEADVPVVSGELVDPLDAAAPDQLYTVQDLGEVYTVDGQSMAAAHITDAQGTDLMMVDIDGDLVLDVVTDMNGNQVASINGGVSLSDLEYNMGGNEYIAQNEIDEMEHHDEDDSYMNDLIDPMFSA